MHRFGSLLFNLSLHLYPLLLRSFLLFLQVSFSIFRIASVTMDNITSRITSSVASLYDSCHKAVSEMRSKPKESTSNAAEGSAESPTGGTTDIIPNNDGDGSEELAEDSQNIHGSKHHAIIEGRPAEVNNIWLLVDPWRAPPEQMHSGNLAKEKHKPDPTSDKTGIPVRKRRKNQKQKEKLFQDTKESIPHRRKEHVRYISRIVGTEISCTSEQGAQGSHAGLPTGYMLTVDGIPLSTECPPEDVEPDGRDNNRTYSSSRIERWLAMTDDDVDAEIDMLIEDTNKYEINESQATVDGEDCDESEWSTYRSEESSITTTTTTDSGRLSYSESSSNTSVLGAECWVPVPGPSPNKTLVAFGTLKKKLKAKAEQCGEYFKYLVREPVNTLQARTRFEPHRRYALNYPE
ncbi:hypothetical protein F4859DRAFT_391168 [Xylaria cf. heliscus]|nr:hypothetical protein F4859DRAFT_391168 [Xylaria cf. heliscus]